MKNIMYKDLLRKFNKHQKWTMELLNRSRHTNLKDLEVFCAAIDEVRLNVSVPKQLESLKKVSISVFKHQSEMIGADEFVIEMQAQSILLLLQICYLPVSVNEKAIQKFRAIFKKAFKTSWDIADELVEQDLADMIDKGLSKE